MASTLFWVILIALGALTVVWTLVAGLVVPAFTGSSHPQRADCGAVTRAVPGRAAAQPDRTARRDPPVLRRVHDPGDRAGGLEPRDPGRADRAAFPLPRREQGLRVRDRMAGGDRRAVPDGVRRAAEDRVQGVVRLRLARPAREAGADPVHPGNDQHRDRQPRHLPERRLRVARLERGAGRDQRRVPDLHAAAGDLQRRGRDRAVPDAQPHGGAPRRERDAQDDRQRHAPDQSAADSVLGAAGRARDTDHTAGLPARHVPRRLDPPGLDGAVLVLVQPSVRRREPAAEPGVLRAQAAVDPDQTGGAEHRRRRGRQRRALQAVGHRGTGDRDRGRQHRDDRAPAVPAADRVQRLSGGRADADDHRRGSWWEP